SYQIEGKPLISQFSGRIQRGDKIALVGPNGCGKTTLLKLLLDQIKPDSGTVHCGTRLEVAYFDQHRATLDPEKTVMDNLAEGKQEVMVGGCSRHVLGYLQDFLFPPQRAMTPVKALSGGERNRLLLAQLFVRPSNLLILDEPTNDLDIETLELLEELLDNYQGTVLLVSHDRQFVDNCVTECWIFSGQGVIERYPGGYYDAMEQQAVAKPLKAILTQKENISEEKAEKASSTRRNSNKLSYHLVRELQQLPQKIEQLEQQLAALQAQVNDDQFFAQSHEQTSAVLSELATVESELEQTFARWEELEQRNNE
ncbi:MAG: ATP-binding cassette domain-containing protein, partial [Enterobacteriaceae bacterium]